MYYERSQRQQIGYEVSTAPPARAPVAVVHEARATEPTRPEARAPVAVVPEARATEPTRPLNVETPVEMGNCVICQRLMRSSQSIKQLHCNHMFHLLCFRSYLRNNNTTCPICRCNI